MFCVNFSFRHFFAHRFHPDIVEQTLDVFNTLDDSVEGSDELQGDLVGALVAAASSFYNNVIVFNLYYVIPNVHASHQMQNATNMISTVPVLPLYVDQIMLLDFKNIQIIIDIHVMMLVPEKRPDVLVK